MIKKIPLELVIVVVASLIVAFSGNMASPPARSATQAIFVHTPPAHRIASNIT